MNNSALFKVARVLSIAIMALAAIFTVMLFSQGDEPGSAVDSFFYLTYAVLGIGIALAIIFPIFFMAQNPKNALKSLAMIGAFVLVFGLSYALASDAFDTPKLMDLASKEVPLEASTVKNVGMGLIGTYIVAGIAILATVFSSVTKLFK